MNEQAIELIKEVLVEFDWHNYRLDEVEQAESHDWADELATEIVQNVVNRQDELQRPTEDSNLVKHAIRELELCGQTEEDPVFAQSLVDAVRAFASYGHSGGSASVAINQLYELLQFRSLSPLTNDPDEWFKHADDHAGRLNLWQSKRDPAAFSTDGGQTHYYVDDRSDRGTMPTATKGYWDENS